MADFILAFGEIGNLDAAFHAMAHAVGGGGQLAQRACNRRCEEKRQDDHDERHDAEHAENRHAFGLHDLVDIVAFSGKQEDAQDCARTLDRHGHGDDQLALFVAPLRRLRRTGQRLDDFRIGEAVAAGLFLIDRQAAAVEQVRNPCSGAFPDGRGLFLDRRQVIAQHRSRRREARRIERARIEQHVGIAIIDARARVLVGEISRRSNGETFSGLMGNSQLSGESGEGVRLCPACSSRSFSGSIISELVSTVAEAEIAPAMILPCVSRLSIFASISPSRN